MNQILNQVDWQKERFWEEVEGDQELAQELLKRFLSSAQHLLEEIEASLARGDLDTAKEKAHSLKGAAGIIHCEGLRREALALEKTSSLEEAASHLSHLRELYQRFVRLLQAQQPGLAN